MRTGRRMRYSHDMAHDSEQRESAHLPLADPATVVVVGGGPAGSFFAIRLLRRARESGRSVRVVVLEKKNEICFYSPTPFSAWEGCNFCAGGISPRLNDILAENGIVLPADVIESEADEVIVHGDWKSIELPVPRNRRMVSVFRGSRPRNRADRYENFDSFLLATAVKEGAEAITAEVEAVRRSADGRPVVTYRTPVCDDPGQPPETIEADFVVVAAGVNRSPGGDPANDPLLCLAQGAHPRAAATEAAKDGHRRDVRRRRQAGAPQRRGALRGVRLEAAAGGDGLAHPQGQVDDRRASRQGRGPRRRLGARAGDAAFRRSAPHSPPTATRHRVAPGLLLPSLHDRRSRPPCVRHRPGPDRRPGRLAPLQRRALLGLRDGLDSGRLYRRRGCRPGLAAARLRPGHQETRRRQPLRPGALLAQPLGLQPSRAQPSALSGRADRAHGQRAGQAAAWRGALAHRERRRQLRQHPCGPCCILLRCGGSCGADCS